MQSFKHILVATDFSEHSERAVQLARDLAIAFQSSLTLLHVYERPIAVFSDAVVRSENLFEPSLEEAESELAELVELIGREIPQVSGKIRQGMASQQILAAAQECGADLIVMGTHGRRRLARTLLGSVAEKVIRHSSIPVLTARQPVRAAAVSSAA